MQKKYIFVTSEGKAFAPNGREVGNSQVVGIVEDVESEDEALIKLLKENDWIFDCGFNVAEFKIHEIL